MFIDLSATSISEYKSNLINYKNDENYLKVMSIYGANASGKSNVLGAFSLMKFWVLNSFARSEENKAIPLKRFEFSETGKKKSSLFEVFFSIDDKEYQYGFNLDSEKVISEWLYKRNFRYKNKYELVFERDGQKYNLKESLKNNTEILKSMNEKTLLVTFLSRLKNQDAIDVLKWFQLTNVINFGDTTFEFIVSKSLAKVNLENENEYSNFINFLIAFDLGIHGIRIEKIDGGDYPEVELESRPRYKVFTQHKNIETEKMEEIPLADESSGTIKMISLYFYLDEALKNGYTVFIDEMDAKLHPLLTRYIINLFQDDLSNRKGAQLIFTTHDSSTLSKDLFRRDQIWFVEKDNRGISNIYSLAEYKLNNVKVRKDASYNKDYLGGRYGAVPDFSDYKVGE